MRVFRPRSSVSSTGQSNHILIRCSTRRSTIRRDTDFKSKGWFHESGLFGPVEHRKYPWKWQRTTLSFTDFLRTRLEYLTMEPAKREEMLGEIAKAIDDQGGELTLDYETHLYIARR